MFVLSKDENNYQSPPPSPALYRPNFVFLRIDINGGGMNFGALFDKVGVSCS